MKLFLGDLYRSTTHQFVIFDLWFAFSSGFGRVETLIGEFLLLDFHFYSVWIGKIGHLFENVPFFSDFSS